MPMEDSSLKEALVQGGIPAASAEEIALRLPAKNLTQAGVTALQTVMGSRPVRVMNAGASQHSRCSMEARIVDANITNEVCTVNTNAAHTFCNGQLAFVALPGIHVFGPLTVTGSQQLTIPAPTRENTGSIAGGVDLFVFVTGVHTGASWLGHLHSRYGLGMQVVANVSQHGSDVNETAQRLPAILAAIESTQPDLVFFEPGWGNSINNGATLEEVLPVARANLAAVCAVAPRVVLTALPPPEAGGSYASNVKRDFMRLHRYVMQSVQAEFPNVIPVDTTTSLLNYTSGEIGSIQYVHSDALHWTPYGAKKVAECYYAQLDKIIPQLPVGRMGASDVWANGNKQLFDGLLTNAGGGSLGSGASGAIDATMSISRSGGSGATATCSLVALPNGLYAQRVVAAFTSNTPVWVLSCTGSAGNLMAARMAAGRTYKIAVKMSISGATGVVRSISVMARATMTGVANLTGSRTVWAGRSMEGAVEGSGVNGFAQYGDEPSRWYVGNDWTVPAGATVTVFDVAVVIKSGSASAGVTVDIEDIMVLDVTGGV